VKAFAMTHSTISQILIIVALLRLRVAPALALGSYWIHHHHRRSGPATAISVKPDADDIFTADDYDFFTGSPSTPGKWLLDFQLRAKMLLESLEGNDRHCRQTCYWRHLSRLVTSRHDQVRFNEASMQYFGHISEDCR